MKLRDALICLSIIFLFSCSENKVSFTEIYNVSDTLFSIGAEADPDNDFIIPRSVLVDSNMNIYVLDGRENNIKVFDENGKYNNSISSNGKGPDQLSYPVEMHFNNKQNIIIYDLLLRRFSKFSIDGEHLGNIKFNKRVNKFDVDENNNYYVEQMDRRIDKNDMYIISKLYKYDSLLECKILIDSTELKKNIIITEPVEMRLPIPFLPEFLWKLKGDGTVLTMVTDSCNAKIFTNDIVIKKNILNEEYRVKVKNRDKENHIKSSIIATEDGSSKMPESISSQIQFPKYKPYVTKIALFNNEFLIQTNFEKGAQTLYHIIDIDGNIIASTFLLSKVFDNIKLESDGFIYSSEYKGGGVHILSKYSYNKK